MQQDWEIRSRSHSCSRTGHEFSEGELFYTLLFRDRAGLRREDLCEEAWTNRSAEEPAPFSYWRTRYVAPPPPEPEPLDKQDAEGLLRHMIGQQSDANARACYILALMLERKRTLRPIDSPDGDDAMLVYEHAKTGESFVLPNPRLSIEQIPEVQEEVAELLRFGGPTRQPEQ